MKLFEIKKDTSTWLLCESAAGKNTHIEHIEDLIYNEGYMGAQKALNYLEGIRQMLAQGEGAPQTKITVKWDGAPAIVCGTDPADGKFFVGTKSVFAINQPKICKSATDIHRFYPEQEELANKLMAALKYLKSLGIGNVLQGDLMFTPGDVTTANFPNQLGVDEQYYIFTPNTITYAVPVASALGKRIAQAKIGIIFHTAYEGASMPEMTAQFGASVSGLSPSNSVWFDDATYKDYTGRASLTPSEDSDIRAVLSAAASTFRKISESDFNRIIFTGRTTKSGSEEYTEFANYIKPFVNSMVRDGQIIDNPTDFLKNFLEFYKSRQESEIAKLKTGPTGTAAQNRLQKIKDKEEFMVKNSNTLLGILAIYKRIVEIKLLLIKKMQQIEHIGAFIKTDAGYRVTAPEGFVAIGHDGNAVKLVDRIEFSRANFQANKTWKKD